MGGFGVLRAGDRAFSAGGWVSDGAMATNPAVWAVSWRPRLSEFGTETECSNLDERSHVG